MRANDTNILLTILTGIWILVYLYHHCLALFSMCKEYAEATHCRYDQTRNRPLRILTCLLSLSLDSDEDHGAPWRTPSPCRPRQGSCNVHLFLCFSALFSQHCETCLRELHENVFKSTKVKILFHYHQMTYRVHIMSLCKACYIIYLGLVLKNNHFRKTIIFANLPFFLVCFYC